MIAALDTDKNGTVSAAELGNSTQSLKQLDRNADGELSLQELLPIGPPPPRGGQQGGGDRPQGPPPPDGPDETAGWRVSPSVLSAAIITDRAELEPVQASPSTMKRIVLLLIPVIALAVGVTDPSAPTAREEMTGQLWQASIRAEADGDASAAMEKVTACAKHGGDAYMADLRGGWLCYSARKHDEASRCYDAAANLQPNALSPRLGLLNIAQAKNDGAAAILAAEAVLKIEPTNYRALMAVAWGALPRQGLPALGPSPISGSSRSIQRISTPSAARPGARSTTARNARPGTASAA